MKQRTERSLVLAVFDDELVVDTAARAMRRRLSTAAPSGSSISLGVLVKRPDGSIPAGKLGPRATDSGPGVGAMLGVIARAVGGEGTLPKAADRRGIAEEFFHEGSGLTRDDVIRLGAELDSGRPVMGVLAGTADEGSWAIVELTELGGKTETHLVSEEALRLAAEEPF